MKNNTIDRGIVTASQDYLARAQHAPQTPEEIARAAHDLAAAGYCDHGIAGILQADVNSVRRLLGERG